MSPVIVWFRRNLRIADNAALAAAAETGRAILPVYVLTDEDVGGASRWWLHHSLAGLDGEVRQRGSRLLLYSGTADQVLDQLVADTGAEAVYFSRRCEPASRAEEASLESVLGERIDLHGFDDGLLHHPHAVTTQSGTPFRVFTPFWKAASSLGEPPLPIATPDSLEFAAVLPTSQHLEDLDLLPTAPDWAQGLRDTWRPGEAGGLDRLDELEPVVRDYGDDRDRPDLDTTSRLSPHLYFGEVSVRQVWHAVRGFEARLQSSRGAEALLRQLYWRDFSAYLLYHFPKLPTEPLREEFDAFPWSDDDDSLRAWQKGQTGYPIVDAGMRQLWATGWMHNRVRMIVASFLVKDLLIPWQQGADWFLDTLVDADLANNSASWQWVAGCGTDAAPYFRIFNPVLQGKRFDPDGAYVRRWVPELANLPPNIIHEPWKATAAELDLVKSPAGADYPVPIVNHGAARDAALAAYQTIRSKRASSEAPGSS